MGCHVGFIDRCSGAKHASACIQMRRTRVFYLHLVYSFSFEHAKKRTSKALHLRIQVALLILPFLTLSVHCSIIIISILAQAWHCSTQLNGKLYPIPQNSTFRLAADENTATMLSEKLISYDTALKNPCLDITESATGQRKFYTLHTASTE